MNWKDLTPDLRRRLLGTLVLFALLITIALPPANNALFGNAFFTRIDNAATVRIEEALGRAVAVFAMARITNGIISVIQESEVAISPAGVGLNLAPGQILDPLNDLVERFSWVMLAALSSLGIQRFLIEISSWVAIDILGSLALTLWIIGLWCDRRWPLSLALLAKKIAFLALVIRFAVPVSAGLNESVYRYFMAEEYLQASEVISSGNEELQHLESVPAPLPNDGWWQQFRTRLQQAEQAFDFERLRSWLGQYSNRMIDKFVALLVIFLLNTIILPLAFLWGIFRLYRAITGSSATDLEKRIIARLSARTREN